MQTQLVNYLTEHDLMPVHQSAYRKFHSTETALLKVFNDLLQAADQGQVSALCLLDLTAAFDTVDHHVLLQRLQRSFGIEDCALAWFSSYLSDRSYCVVYGGVSSQLIYVMCSVPQGSVLGPLLFILYTAELAELAYKYGVMLHAFTDDTQLYLHCRTNQAEASVETLERCIDAISCWMSANRLRLNTDKTELIWTGAKSKLECLPGRGLPVTLGCDTINVSSVARVLGVLITPDLSLEQHIDAVCAKCFFQLRQLRRVRRTLDDDSIAILVHAFVTSRIDYIVSASLLVHQRQAAASHECSCTYHPKHPEIRPRSDAAST